MIINRYSSHEAVTLEQIERAVHLPIAIKIPNNYGELVRSINIGEPLLLDGKSDFSLQMMKWAASLVKGCDAHFYGTGEEEVRPVDNAVPEAGRGLDELTVNVGTRVVPAIIRSAKPVALKYSRKSKYGAAGTIKRLDLEKIALMHENPASQQQLVTVIQQLINEQNIPLSAQNATGWRRRCWMRSSGLVRWNHCFRTRQSTTFWSIPTTRFM